MQTAIQAFLFFGTIGAILIGILLYYHKQTPAVWTTFATILSFTLSFCLNWQQSIWQKNPNRQTEESQNPEKMTLLSLFESDFNLGRINSDKTITFDDGVQVNIKLQQHFDFEKQTEFIGLFIPSTPKTFDLCVYFKDNYNMALTMKDSILMESSGIGLQGVNTSELKFSGRVFIYHEYHLLESQKRELFTLYEDNNLSPQFRDNMYLHEKKKVMETK